MPLYYIDEQGIKKYDEQTADWKESTLALAISFAEALALALAYSKGKAHPVPITVQGKTIMVLTRKD